MEVHTPSAYDIAWVAMVPSEKYGGPLMFPQCLKWIIENQNFGGFWGGEDDCNSPTADCLRATLACIAALKTWGWGRDTYTWHELGLRRPTVLLTT
ncbi:hypothetical protein AMTR_s00003p00255690 [Amborella trichopoda]|uniref:Squalene cyclase N-terminal domain-containing protein n=1 Tax=Amborella trichopoda TaxID=13333 RepID=W1P8S6_AMBTC|nr:hypothetical protein AMTR_s00003p00255690 [Amborella trichopoda]